ncbi:MAG TPA: GGDEF domain-containing protein [Thermoanaerobaculia bacterium]|nr:GGDEF domain-containing protein [Thermoanaerobaculia bacterium]
MLDTTPNLSDPGVITPVSTPACVVQIYGGPLGRRVELTGGAITIGRDDENRISVDLNTVSRRHSRVFSDGAQHFVEDLESTNGTFVNDREVDTPTALRNGDLIKCGGAVFKFIEGGNVEALYHEEIHRLTLIDGLTQIANKRHFTEFLERELARAVRHQRPLALLMFDIDHFKQVNDGHGHLAGDRVLCGVAALVAHEVRREELFARWGGEEFAVVLPETAIDGAARFGERLRHIVEEASFVYDEEPLRVTVSVGATALAAGDSLETFVERADALLGRAKQGGRNRVCAE